MKRIYLCTIFLLTACASERETLKPVGTTATLKFDRNSSVKAELISIQESTFVALGDTLLVIPIHEVQSLEVRRERQRSWIPALVATLGPPVVVLPTVVFTTAFIATWLFYEFTEPRTEFNEPFGKRDLEELRLYSRYPQRLTTQQLAALSNSLVGIKP